MRSLLFFLIGFLVPCFLLVPYSYSATVIAYYGPSSSPDEPAYVCITEGNISSPPVYIGSTYTAYSSVLVGITYRTDASVCSKVSDRNFHYYYVKVEKRATGYFYFVYGTDSESEYLPNLPTSENGHQDSDEDGIDCGGSTGVECQISCPDGFILANGLCYKASENPYPAGTEYPNGEISDGEPWVHPGIAADPLQHSPDYVPTASDWEEVQEYNPSNVGVGSVTYDKQGDYIIRDENGNIIEAQIIGEHVSQTDNDDGTTTTITQDKIYKDGKTSITSTTTTVKDNATGEVLTQYTEEPSDNLALIGAGRGSTEPVTGDQYSKGVESIVDAINGDPDVEDSSWSDLEYTQTDIEYEPLDESQYDYESYIDNFIDTNHNVGWLSVISDSGIQTSNPYCSIDGEISLGSSTHTLSFSLCEFEVTFQAMGTWLALLVQISALIITFGGLE
ncbi:MAG: hypothetical protein RBR52_15250 [Thiomonas sp.]|uniref:hypothetical protein n=1 Tax=Thiomonas sp. TaxID=2047785 RepID=UPI002A36D03E|nr:hypothetical protein [Thiomonas sp.]MDY0331833.1 hypothetical protein [Thiomonas sp.]